ncbi:MAG TPA: hypothetical protein VH352_15295 [Pseudonocardiaceae bacterium]|nr:hypothetical protein [Pseudonocardiaceae bacterium]
MIRLRGIIPAIAAEAVLTFGLARLIGTPAVWSALIALPIALVLLLMLTTPAGIEPLWSAPPVPPSAATHLEASTLASRLDDAMVDKGRFRGRVQPRLATLALALLRGRPGMADLPDLTDGRAVAALGPELHALLTNPAATLPEPPVLLALLTRLEAP